MPENDPVMSQIVEAYERDRETIALELHDNIAQSLASALHFIQAAEQAAQSPEERRQSLLRAHQLVRQSLEELRGIMGELKPPILDRLGLVETLRYELRQLQEETKWQIQLELDPVVIPSKMELPLYRIVREAIINAQKHSLTRSLRFRLSARPDGLMAEVQDYGKGFDPSRTSKKGVGLLSMRTRARALGGECLVQSEIGRGTTVQVYLPLPKP